MFRHLVKGNTLKHTLLVSKSVLRSRSTPVFLLRRDIGTRRVSKINAHSVDWSLSSSPENLTGSLDLAGTATSLHQKQVWNRKKRPAFRDGPDWMKTPLCQHTRTRSHSPIAGELGIKGAGTFQRGRDHSTQYSLEISAYSELCRW